MSLLSDLAEVPPSLSTASKFTVACGLLYLTVGLLLLVWPGAVQTLFFDPAFDAEIAPIDPDQTVADDRAQRWDRASVHDLSGTYGDYLLAKVAKVFPGLGRDVL